MELMDRPAVVSAPFLGAAPVRAAKRQRRAAPPLAAAPRAAAAAAPAADPVWLGIDFGTSGARAVAIDGAGAVLASARAAYAAGDAAVAWEAALFELLASIPAGVRARAAGLAIDGTSATALLVDADSGAVLAPPRLYNEAQPAAAVAAAAALAPAGHTAAAPTSSLCKLLAWTADGAWQAAAAGGRRPVLQHQADWLASLLHGDRRVSDWNNCLKLGYDAAAQRFPGWLEGRDFSALLPARVVPPGAAVASVAAAAAARAGLPETCVVKGGTTDSIAAFLAAGVSAPGDAVTSLGSTLAVKLLSEAPVEDGRTGVYSHRVGAAWLVGGASNTGGAVLRKYFTDDELRALTPRLDPGAPTGLDYVPLLAPGERFPVADPALAPRLEPRPADDAVFLQGILEAMARTEARAYKVIEELGGARVRAVWTAGGGAANPAWTELRRRALGGGVPVAASPNSEAAYGAALLARGLNL